DAVAVGVVLILIAAPVGSDELQDHAAGPQDPMPGAADLIDHGLELARRVPGELHHAPQSISSAEVAPLAVALRLRDEIAGDLRNASARRCLGRAGRTCWSAPGGRSSRRLAPPRGGVES